jgi:hypothetical protein
MNWDEIGGNGRQLKGKVTLRKSLTAIFLALAPVGALALVPAAPAQAQQITISVSLFHQQLAPHGRWFQHPRYGWAWFPTTVDAQWQPYSRGQWVWTEEYGWYWNSDEPFGWATYHYGRWGYDEVYGWIWIPGSTWGPAWVAFRYSEGYVGWAPLPPETLQISFGFDTRYTDMSANYYEPRWMFVPRNRFLDARIYSYAAPLTQNNVYIRQTVNVTNYVTVNNVIVNRSVDRQRMETAIGRKIAVARVKDVNDVRKSGRRGATEIDAYRPQVRVTPGAAPPAAARAKPGDKPRYAVHKDATPPSERRDASPTTPSTQPPARTTPQQPPARTTPPSVALPPAKPPATTEPPTRTAPPEQPARTTPRAPTTPPKEATPPEKPPATTQPPTRTAPPEQPARTTPRAPTTPPKEATPPEKPPATTQPPTRTAPPEQPAKTPPAKPGEPEKRTTPPDKPGEPEKKTDDDDKKK